MSRRLSTLRFLILDTITECDQMHYFTDHAGSKYQVKAEEPGKDSVVVAEFADKSDRDMFFTLVQGRNSDVKADDDRMLQWFTHDHLPSHLQTTSAMFSRLATFVVGYIASGPERTVALRKLLEAKDAAVRAVVKPGA